MFNAHIAGVTEGLRVKCPYLNPSPVGGGGGDTHVCLFSCPGMCVFPLPRTIMMYGIPIVWLHVAPIYLTFCTLHVEETVA